MAEISIEKLKGTGLFQDSSVFDTIKDAYLVGFHSEKLEARKKLQKPLIIESLGVALHGIGEDFSAAARDKSIEADFFFINKAHEDGGEVSKVDVEQLKRGLKIAYTMFSPVTGGVEREKIASAYKDLFDEKITPYDKKQFQEEIRTLYLEHTGIDLARNSRGRWE
jgi:hypothetical protein